MEPKTKKIIYISIGCSVIVVIIVVAIVLTQKNKKETTDGKCKDYTDCISQSPKLICDQATGQCIINPKQISFKDDTTGDIILLSDYHLQNLAGDRNIKITNTDVQEKDSSGNECVSNNCIYGAFFDPLDQSLKTNFIQIGDVKLTEDRFAILNGAEFRMKPFEKWCPHSQSVTKPFICGPITCVNSSSNVDWHLTAGKWQGRPGRLSAEFVDDYFRQFFNPQWNYFKIIQIEGDKNNSNLYKYKDENNKEWSAPGWALKALLTINNLNLDGAFAITIGPSQTPQPVIAVVLKNNYNEGSMKLIPNDGTNPNIKFTFDSNWAPCGP